MNATIIQFPRQAPANTRPCLSCGKPIIVGGWSVCSQHCWDAWTAHQDALAAEWAREVARKGSSFHVEGRGYI